MVGVKWNQVVRTFIYFWQREIGEYKIQNSVSVISYVVMLIETKECSSLVNNFCSLFTVIRTVGVVTSNPVHPWRVEITQDENIVVVHIKFLLKGRKVFG